MPITFVGLVTVRKAVYILFLIDNANKLKKENKRKKYTFFFFLYGCVSMNRRRHMREKKNEIDLVSNNRKLIVTMSYVV